MIKSVYKCYCRNFKVISIAQAKEWNLIFVRNVYGDDIHYYGCRSIWADIKGREYRVSHLHQ
jgi:hypothetical protein